MDNEKNDEDMITTDEASKITGLAVVTLKSYRYDGKGPPYYQPGGKKVVYSRSELMEWMQECHIQPEGENNG